MFRFFLNSLAVLTIALWCAIPARATSDRKHSQSLENDQEKWADSDSFTDTESDNESDLSDEKEYSKFKPDEDDSYEDDQVNLEDPENQNETWSSKFKDGVDESIEEPSADQDHE